VEVEVDVERAPGEPGAVVAELAAGPDGTAERPEGPPGGRRRRRRRGGRRRRRRGAAAPVAP
jgi:hypothetical protein